MRKEERIIPWRSYYYTLKNCSFLLNKAKSNIINLLSQNSKAIILVSIASQWTEQGPWNHWKMGLGSSNSNQNGMYIWNWSWTESSDHMEDLLCRCSWNAGLEKWDLPQKGGLNLPTGSPKVWGTVDWLFCKLEKFFWVKKQSWSTRSSCQLQPPLQKTILPTSPSLIPCMAFSLNCNLCTLPKTK